MNQLAKCLIFLALVSSVVCLDFGHFLGFQREAREEPPKDPEIPEVVETVRWRQSVCVVPGPNVPPCFNSLKKYENEHKKNSERRADENVGDSTDEAKLDRKTGRALSLERDHLNVSRILTPKVMRVMEIENSPSEQVQTSEKEENLHLNIRSATPGLEVAYGRRQGKYLIIATASPTASPSTPPPVISVTKVLNSPVTATLVAKNCFPDIGVPLCNDYQETLTIYKKPKIESKRDSEEKNYRHRDHHSHRHGQRQHGRERNHQMDEEHDSFLHNSQTLLDRIKEMSSAPFPSSPYDSQIISQTQLKPQVLTIVESQKIEETSTTSRPIHGFGSLFPMDLFEKRNNTNKPGLQQVVTQSIQTAGSLLFGSAQEAAVQAVQGVLDQSQVVVADKEPEMQSVVVLEPTQKPGFFANVWGPGSFNIFNKITIYDSTTNKPMNSDTENVQSESLPSANTDRPEETKVTEFLDNPQSDHSVTSSQDKLTTITDDSNGNVAQLDQPSGTSDELVDNLTESENKTDKDQESSLVVEHSPLLNSQNKPLIVERPGQRPLLVERPIYVSEKPALSALFNFVRASEDQPLMNVDHEVARDIVYVYVEPQSLTGLQAWFSIFVRDELIRNKKNETVSIGMGNVEEEIVDSIEEEPETIVKVSTTPGTISTVVENADTITTGVPTVPEVAEVTEENLHTVSEVETSMETGTLSTGKIVRKTPEVTTLPYAEETTTTIVGTVTTEVPTVPEVTEVTGETENSTETQTIPTGEIDPETPEVTTLPYVEETTTTVVDNVDTVTTEVPTVPDVTEVTVALRESTPEADASETHETDSPVAQQLVNTTPEASTIPEAAETTTATGIVTEVDDSETVETETVTEQDDTETKETSTYPEEPEVPEVSSTSSHVVSEVRRPKKREVSLPVIDKILTSLRENWTVPEDVELFSVESEFVPESVILEEPATTQPGLEETTTGAPETFTMSGVAEVSAEGSGYSIEVEFSQTTDTENLETAKEKRESVTEVDVSEETETTTITTEAIDTTTPEVSTFPEGPTTIIPEVVRETDRKIENVPEVENSESPENHTSPEADEVSEENSDSMEKRDIQTTTVPSLTTKAKMIVPVEEMDTTTPEVSTIPEGPTTIIPEVVRETDRRTEKVPEVENSESPENHTSPEAAEVSEENSDSMEQRDIQTTTVASPTTKAKIIVPDIVESVRILAEYERNHLLNRRRGVSIPVKRDEDTVPVFTVPEHIIGADQTLGYYAKIKEPERPTTRKPYIKMPEGLESIEAVREYERTHVFVHGLGFIERPKETTPVPEKVATTTQSVQTVPEEVEASGEKMEFVGEVNDSRNAGTLPTLIETLVTETTEFPIAPETIIVPEADEHPETSTSTIVHADQVNAREEQQTSPTVVEKIVNHWTIGTLQ